MCAVKTSAISTLIFILAIAMPACSQTPLATSGKESAPKELKSNANKQSISTDSSHEGPISITYSEIFEYGSTKWSAISVSSLQDIPPLPTGYESVNELAYKVESEAVTSGFNITVFHVPSVQNQVTFNKLAVLHLEFDELSPHKKAWVDRTILPSRWRDGYFAQVSKESFQKAVPDFTTRRVSAINQGLGIFVLTQVNQLSQPSDHAFTEIEASTISAPAQVVVGDNVTYTITIKNKGPKSAGEVNLQNNLDIDIDFLSARSSQGTCRQSEYSDDRVICNLGALPLGANATITIIGRVRNNVAMDTGTRKRYNRTSIVFKERPSDMASYLNTARHEIFTVTVPSSNGLK